MVLALLASRQNKQPRVVRPSREAEQPVADQHAEQPVADQHPHQRQWWPWVLADPAFEVPVLSFYQQYRPSREA